MHGVSFARSFPHNISLDASCAHTIADAMHGLDVLTNARTCSVEFLTQGLNMHIDRSGMPYERFAPYRLEELRSAQGMPHMRNQHPKKIEFLYGELHGFPLHRARMRIHIKVDAVAMKFVRNLRCPPLAPARDDTEREHGLPVPSCRTALPNNHRHPTRALAPYRSRTLLR